MPAVLIPRPVSPWRRAGALAVKVLAVGVQAAVGLLVIVLRTVRVAVNLVTATAMHAEQRLADHTGRPVLSHTGIAAIAAAFVHEFRTAHTRTTR